MHHVWVHVESACAWAQVIAYYDLLKEFDIPVPPMDNAAYHTMEGDVTTMRDAIANVDAVKENYIFRFSVCLSSMSNLVVQPVLQWHSNVCLATACQRSVTDWLHTCQQLSPSAQDQVQTFQGLVQSDSGLHPDARAVHDRLSWTLTWSA